MGSSKVISTNSQPPGTVSSEVYVPGGRLLTTICPPSVMVPDASPVNVNVWADPSGIVCFSTIIVPLLVFLNVTVTVSPGSSPMLLGSLPSLQYESVKSHPAGTVSATS